MFRRLLVVLQVQEPQYLHHFLVDLVVLHHLLVQRSLEGLGIQALQVIQVFQWTRIDLVNLTGLQDHLALHHLATLLVLWVLHLQVVQQVQQVLDLQCLLWGLEHR